MPTLSHLPSDMPSSKSLRMGHHRSKNSYNTKSYYANGKVFTDTGTENCSVPDAKHFATEIFKMGLIKLH
jgi:hypothetical protein